jgi:hypothetical protein
MSGVSFLFASMDCSNVTKMNTEQEGQTSFVKSSKNSADMELVQEKSEKLKPFWKLIDNKIVKVTTLVFLV